MNKTPINLLMHNGFIEEDNKIPIFSTFLFVQFQQSLSKLLNNSTYTVSNVPIMPLLEYINKDVYMVTKIGTHCQNS